MEYKRRGGWFEAELEVVTGWFEAEWFEAGKFEAEGFSRRTRAAGTGRLAARRHSRRRWGLEEVCWLVVPPNRRLAALAARHLPP